MVDRSDEVLGVTIAVGPMTYELDLVVHPFEGAIGDPDVSPGQDAGSMVTPVSICCLQPYRRCAKNILLFRFVCQ